MVMNYFLLGVVSTQLKASDQRTAKTSAFPLLTMAADDFIWIFDYCSLIFDPLIVSLEWEFVFILLYYAFRHIQLC